MMLTPQLLSRAGAPKILISRVLAQDLDVRSKPYDAIRSAGGSIEIADQVALVLKLPLSRRVLGHAQWILASRPLHVSMLVARLQFSLELPPSTVRTILDKILSKGDLVQIENNIVPLTCYQQNVDIVTEVKRRIACTLPNAALQKAFSSIHVVGEQRDAVNNAAKYKLSIITGGPGVGKSHVVREMIAAFPKARVTAPTGRAARNASGKTVHYFKTIQESGKNDFAGTELIVVDEASMLSTDLFWSVLELAPKMAHIVLVGDVNQLPPIDTGEVLRDLLDVVPTVHLTKNLRSTSGIQSFAAGILKGDVDIEQDVEVVPCESLSDVIGILAGMKDEVVLTPHNKTRIELNKAIQLRTWAKIEEIDIVLDKDFPDAPRGTRGIARMLPGENNMVHVHADNGVKFVASLAASVDLVSMDARAGGLKAEAGSVIISGDKVIVTKNTASACNGDIGVYTHSHVVRFPDHDAMIPEISETDPGMVLAYCITVHKSQGSEFDTVVIPVTNVTAWSRTLLYTAVTRAKTRVVILGTKDDLQKIVRSASPARTSILRALFS